MTLTSLIASLIGSIDLKELADDARALMEDGATEEEIHVIVAALLDAAVPEELVGAWADAAMEPMYRKAADKIVAMVAGKLGKLAKPKRPGLPALVQREIDRVKAVIAARGQG